MFSDVRGHVSVEIAEAVERAQGQMKGETSDEGHDPVKLLVGSQRHF